MNALRQVNHHILVGKVEKGKQLGRTIGFPTANLNLLAGFSVSDGVYGVHVYNQSTKYLGILNVGNRPTLNDGNHQTAEVHIFDFNESIYNDYLTIEIMFFIRNEKKFNNLNELVLQLQADAYFARKQLRLLES